MCVEHLFTWLLFVHSVPRPPLIMFLNAPVYSVNIVLSPVIQEKETSKPGGDREGHENGHVEQNEMSNLFRIMPYLFYWHRNAPLVGHRLAPP